MITSLLLCVFLAALAVLTGRLAIEALTRHQPGDAALYGTACLWLAAFAIVITRS